MIVSLPAEAPKRFRLVWIFILVLLFCSCGHPDHPPIPLTEDGRATVLKAARALLGETSLPPEKVPDAGTPGTRRVMLSLTRDNANAVMARGEGSTLLEALRSAAASMRSSMRAKDLESGRIKADVMILPGTITAALSSMDPARFDSFIEDDHGRPVQLYRGHRLHPPIDRDSLLRSCRLAGDYLVRHQRDDGIFDYIYDAKKGEVPNKYNELRHAGAAYALLQLYQATTDTRYLKSGDLALEALAQWIRPGKEQHANHNFETIAFDEKEAKLGGAALAVLAFAKYEEVSNDPKWRDHAEKLARFLLFQQGRDGRFESKYFYSKADEESFDSVYYPGEAILALTRLYAIDKNEEWLKAAEKGADWLIEVRDKGKSISDLTHDHWLVIAINDLHSIHPSNLRSEHAAAISQSIIQSMRTASPNPDWIGSFYDPPRVTPASTRAEALVAMSRLALKLGKDPKPYLDALRLITEYQLRCQLNQETAMYLKRPDIASGGFRRSFDDWEVRIDYVQHALCALLGFRELQ